MCHICPALAMNTNGRYMYCSRGESFIENPSVLVQLYRRWHADWLVLNVPRSTTPLAFCSGTKRRVQKGSTWEANGNWITIGLEACKKLIHYYIESVKEFRSIFRLCLNDKPTISIVRGTRGGVVRFAQTLAKDRKFPKWLLDQWTIFNWIHRIQYSEI